MRKRFILIWLLLGFFTSCNPEKETIEFQISGNLKNYSEDVILLQKDTQEETKSVLIATKKKGNFLFRSEKKLSIGPYFLKIGNEPTRIPLLIDNTTISVFLDPTDLSNSYTTGNSEAQVKFSKFQSGSKNTNNLFDYQKRFVEENTNSFLGAMALQEMLGSSQWRLKQTLILYEQLDSTIQHSEIGKEINNYITKGFEKIIGTDTTENEEDISEQSENNTTKETAKTSIEKNLLETTTNSSLNTHSEYAPFFYGDGPNGSEISAKEVFAKNKLTLIDFWASWCVPCRAQNPDYVKLYSKYHNKGFEILSVASDKKYGNWKNAIVTDRMNWIHVNDPYNRIANTYGVSTIPHTLLVNEQGAIIAKKVSTSSLENLLRSKFGE